MHSNGFRGFLRGDIVVSFGVSADGRFGFKALARAIKYISSGDCIIWTEEKQGEPFLSAT